MELSCYGRTGRAAHAVSAAGAPARGIAASAAVVDLLRCSDEVHGPKDERVMRHTGMLMSSWIHGHHHIRLGKE